jgi:hypothetical protein
LEILKIRWLFITSVVDRHRFDVDPDPDTTFHFDADPDPGEMMRIVLDPDPQHFSPVITI